MREAAEPLPGLASYTPMWKEVPVEWGNDLREKGYDIPERHWDLYAKTVDGTNWSDGGDSVLPLAIKAEDHETHYMVNRCIDWISEQSESKTRAFSGRPESLRIPKGFEM